MEETFKEFCARILPIVKAGSEGMAIEVTGDKKQWMPVNDDCGAIRKKVTYRIAEKKSTPLPITPEMWAMVKQKYKFAYLDAGGTVWFSAIEPGWNGYLWVFKASLSNYCESPLIINTTGIISELSLTKRPEQSDSLDAWTYYKQAGDIMQSSQKQFVKPSLSDIREVKYSDDEIKELMKSVRDGRKDGVKAALKEFSEANGTDYLVIEHTNPMTGATQTMRFKIK